MRDVIEATMYDARPKARERMGIMDIRQDRTRGQVNMDT